MAEQYSLQFNFQDLVKDVIDPNAPPAPLNSGGNYKPSLAETGVAGLHWQAISSPGSHKSHTRL